MKINRLRRRTQRVAGVQCSRQIFVANQSSEPECRGRRCKGGFSERVEQVRGEADAERHRHASPSRRARDIAPAVGARPLDAQPAADVQGYGEDERGPQGTQALVRYRSCGQRARAYLSARAFPQADFLATPSNDGYQSVADPSLLCESCIYGMQEPRATTHKGECVLRRFKRAQCASFAPAAKGPTCHSHAATRKPFQLRGSKQGEQP